MRVQYLRNEARELLRASADATKRLQRLNERERFVINNTLELEQNGIGIVGLSRTMGLSVTSVRRIEAGALGKIASNRQTFRISMPSGVSEISEKERQLLVLSALHDGPKHKHLIAKRIEAMLGRYLLDLYFVPETISHLRRLGFLRHVKMHRAEDKGKYELTDEGRRSFEVESERLLRSVLALKESARKLNEGRQETRAIR